MNADYNILNYTIVDEIIMIKKIKQNKNNVEYR